MRILWAAAAGAMLAPGVVLAQTKTAQFAVRASIASDCLVTATDLDFGAYDEDRDVTGRSEVSIRCTPGQAVTIELDGGQSGHPRKRAMQGPLPKEELVYQLYRDAAMRDEIDTRRATWELSGSDNVGQLVTYEVFGVIPSRQQVAPGGYADIIRVIIEY